MLQNVDGPRPVALTGLPLVAEQVTVADVVRPVEFVDRQVNHLRPNGGWYQFAFFNEIAIVHRWDDSLRGGRSWLVLGVCRFESNHDRQSNDQSNEQTLVTI